MGGEEEESLEEMDGFVTPKKKKKFFSKHPVAKKAKVFHVCLAKMADVLVSINFPTPSSKSWSWDFILYIFPKNSVILWNREL